VPGAVVLMRMLLATFPLLNDAALAELAKIAPKLVREAANSSVSCDRTDPQFTELHPSWEGSRQVTHQVTI
jgi:hypothetical protein